MAAYKELAIDEHNYNWVKYTDVLLQHSVEQYRLFDIFLNFLCCVSRTMNNHFTTLLFKELFVFLMKVRLYQHVFSKEIFNHTANEHTCEVIKVLFHSCCIEAQ